MKSKLFFLPVICCLTLASCDIIDEAVQVDKTATGTVYYWISSDADTYVECLTIAGGCSGGDIDHSGYDFVAVAHTSSEIRRAYVNFPQPSFPSGTVVEEAYFELYNIQKNNDGKSDDILLDVNRVHKDWNAGQITYSNQPILTGNGAEFNMKMRSQNWCGTIDIGSFMQQDLLTASNFNGFLVSIQSYEPGYDKGFCSGNHKSRTLTDLGLAPRLLLKVKLPAGFTTDDVQFTKTHADGQGGSYVGFRFRQGADWPADWKLAIRN